MQRRNINIYAHGNPAETGTEFAESNWMGQTIQGTGVMGQPFVRTGPTQVTQEQAPTYAQTMHIAQAGVPIIPLATGALALLGGLGLTGVGGQVIDFLQGGLATMDGNGRTAGPLPTGAVNTLGETVPIGDLPFGLGTPEPKYGVARQWKTKAFAKDVGEYWVYFYQMMDGSMMSWNHRKQQWKTWKPRKPIVLATVKPNMKTMGRAARFIARQFIQIDKSKKKLARSLKV